MGKLALVVVVLLAVAPAASARPMPEPTRIPARTTEQVMASLEPEPISCLTANEWAFPTDDAGWVWYGQPHIYVRDFICEDLTRVANGTLPADNTTAEFAKLIAHEHAHVLGTVDENQAECAGVRDAPSLLVKLGVDPVLAARLAAQIVPFYPLPADCL